MERTRTGSINIFKDLVKEASKNLLMSSPAFRKWRATRPRAGAYYTGSDEELERYAFLGLNLLRKYVGDIKGKSICEIGAGDFLTSGLSMLAAGAERYAVIDRFLGDYSGEIAKKWYGGIADQWTKFYPEITWAKDIKAEDFPENYTSRLELITQPIETATTKNKFDIVCSFQVGEHITDINAFARMNKRLLVEETGVALHRVDFGPHDSWFYYADPLTFLRFPEKLWSLAGSNRGTPNRFRHHEFMEAFERAGFEVDLVDVAYFDEKTIDFARLQPKFQTMPRESMLVGTAMYLLRQKKL
ncbi:MAG: class I SAM-dependent methyltransferase [Acidobacteria bacterium]|nr:class I SAM-dependent methyltransferase [Acidobacteriota bacterium]MCA1637834.1 class I SAM-dependent methyltransferase [Acidobacteriota bacterium]